MPLLPRDRWTRLLEGPRAPLRRVAEALAAAALPGDVLALCGGLGAGKTYFTQRLARGLGVPARVRVTSPTFVLVQRYQGRLSLTHADLYRLGDDPRELDEAGVLALASDGLCVLEWAERFAPALPAATLWLGLERTRPLRRALYLAAPREAAAPHLLRALDAAVVAPPRRGRRP